MIGLDDDQEVPQLDFFVEVKVNEHPTVCSLHIRHEEGMLDASIGYICAYTL